MKKGSNIVIILIVIAVIAGLGYWYTQRNKAEEAETTTEEGATIETSIPAPEVPATDVPVAP